MLSQQQAMVAAHARASARPPIRHRCTQRIAALTLIANGLAADRAAAPSFTAAAAYCDKIPRIGAAISSPTTCCVTIVAHPVRGETFFFSNLPDRKPL
jgi:hypothetical protein